MAQGELFDNTYVLGETRDADDLWLEAQDALWTSAGFGGPVITDLLGLQGSYRVTGRQALEQAAALICLDVLSQDISKATLRLKEKLRGGGERIVDARAHPVAEMLELEPNSRHTWPEYIGMSVFHLGLSSNAYSYVKRSAIDHPIELVPAMPARVQDRVNQRTGEVFYDFQAATVQEAALLGFDHAILPERDVLHVRQRMLDGFWGYSTLIAGGRTLSLGRDLVEYERKVFNEDGLIRGVFTRKEGQGELSEQVFRRTKDQLRKLMRRVRDRGDPILLEDGITYKEIAMKAHEAEMVKALDKQIEMTCKLWRMPPHKAMHLTAVKYENLATMEMVYVRDTLVPLCKLIEARLSKSLLSREDRLRFRFEFDRDEMSIADEKAAVEEAIKLGERGFISHDEVRELRRFNPRSRGKGKVYTVPANVKLVDEEGNTVVTGSKDEAPTPPENVDATDASEEPGAKAAPLRLVS